MIDFNKLIHNYLKRELREKKLGRYYPSECGSCIRKVWYSHKIPRETDRELVKVFQAGNMIHDFIVDVLKSDKNTDVSLIGSEVPFELEIDGLVVSGRIDNIIKLDVDKKIYLVEVKSTSSLKYVNTPNDSHVMQLQLYMHEQKIHDGLILYIEKNTLQTKLFEIKYDFNIVDDAINRFRALHKFLVNDKLPDPEARIEKDMKWQCRNCTYRDECYKATPESVLP